MERNWEILADLPEPRIFHGCGLIPLFNTKFIIVFGGRNSSNIPYNTSILFLDLNDKHTGWKTFSQMKIDSVQGTITGNLIKRLTPTECDLMYTTTTEMHVCKGNFTWTVMQIPTRTNFKKSVPVGLNDLWPCANGLHN